MQDAPAAAAFTPYSHDHPGLLAPTAAATGITSDAAGDVEIMKILQFSRLRTCSCQQGAEQEDRSPSQQQAR
jgi:hypothetical protein